jgi:energy-coupling factor transporter ATP-binding protein EcfA2
MLTDLRIKNLALVNDLAIQFGPGYNSITGETGAGKSILIGALGLVLGERADRTLIRDGDDHCSVEAIIEVAALGKAFHSHLDQNGIEPCEQNQLFLKRSFSASGGNRQFVNGSPTTLNVLASIGEWLVDIHGPHDLENRGGMLDDKRDFRLFFQAGNAFQLIDIPAGFETKPANKRKRNLFTQHRDAKPSALFDALMGKVVLVEADGNLWRTGGDLENGVGDLAIGLGFTGRRNDI